MWGVFPNECFIRHLNRAGFSSVSWLCSFSNLLSNLLSSRTSQIFTRQCGKQSPFVIWTLSKEPTAEEWKGFSSIFVVLHSHWGHWGQQQNPPPLQLDISVSHRSQVKDGFSSSSGSSTSPVPLYGGNNLHKMVWVIDAKPQVIFLSTGNEFTLQSARGGDLFQTVSPSIRMQNRDVSLQNGGNEKQTGVAQTNQLLTSS